MLEGLITVVGGVYRIIMFVNNEINILSLIRSFGT